MKPGDLLRLRGSGWPTQGMTRVVWCDSPAEPGDVLDSAFFPAGTTALLVDFSPWGHGEDRLFVLINSRTGLVWSEEVEPL